MTKLHVKLHRLEDECHFREIPISTTLAETYSLKPSVIISQSMPKVISRKHTPSVPPADGREIVWSLIKEIRTLKH